MFDPTLPQGHNAHSRVRRSGRRKASRKDCLVAALAGPAFSRAKPQKPFGDRP